MSKFQVSQIDHVELFVPDRHKAAAWYEKTLGLKIVAELQHFAEDPNGPLMIAPAAASTKLALFTGTPEGSRRNTGFYRVAFAADLNSFLQFLDLLDSLQLKNQKGTTIGRKHVVDHGKAWSIYFCDPWRHQLELTTYEYAAVQSVLEKQ